MESSYDSPQNGARRSPLTKNVHSLGIPVLGGATLSRSASPRPFSPFIFVKDLENVLVDQNVLTAAEEQAAADRVLPSIGLIVGSAPPDSGCCVVKGLLRIPRDPVALLRETKKASPAVSVVSSLNRRIRDEGSMILGYFFSECKELESFTIDHEAFARILSKTDCSRPIVLRLQRILGGSTGTDVEASIRLDFFSLHQHYDNDADMLERGFQTLRPLPFKIMDSTFTHPLSFRSLIESESCNFEEISSQRTVLAETVNVDFGYDVALSRELMSAERRCRALCSNVYSRLAMETLNLKQLIANRIKCLTEAWIAQRPPSHQQESSEGGTSHQYAGPLPTRASYLLNQLIGRELPAAASDTARKLPISSYIAFYERPLIAMKVLRSNALSSNNGIISNGNARTHSNAIGGKKRKTTAGKTTLTANKGPPRPILPANNRSRTPSVESIIDQSSPSLQEPPPLLSPVPLTRLVTESLLLSQTTLAKTTNPADHIDHTGPVDHNGFIGPIDHDGSIGHTDSIDCNRPIDPFESFPGEAL